MPLRNGSSITGDREIIQMIQIFKKRLNCKNASDILKLLLLESETFKEFCNMEYNFLLKYHGEDLKRIVTRAERRLLKFEKMVEESEEQKQEVETPQEEVKEEEETTETENSEDTE